ncbi:MAG TPA: FGGY family carbohydrate kinase, partial [Sphingobacterium sp.]|nr:FGGY family carbohydrate kinase [Sphingobacterium sp.]
MAKKDAYLIVDIGTGNARVAVVTPTGEILDIQRENVAYQTDNNYEDSIFFKPDQLWQQIRDLSIRALSQSGDVEIKAVTSTSQREGIVIVDAQGQS